MTEKVGIVMGGQISTLPWPEIEFPEAKTLARQSCREYGSSLKR